ncbi:hypothetical protein KRM28CT15_63740 [Krasilnikovia sp. M28-CT-15]
MAAVLAVILIVVAWIALRWPRRLIVSRNWGDGRGPDTLGPEETAYLYSGDRTAVVTATGELLYRRVVLPVRSTSPAELRATLGCGHVELHPEATPLQREIVAALAERTGTDRQTTVDDLAGYPRVQHELGQLRHSLVAAGLLMGFSARALIRLTGLVMAAAGVGVMFPVVFIQLAAERSAATPIGGSHVVVAGLVSLIAVIAGLVWLAAPRRTARGDKAIHELRDRYTQLFPDEDALPDAYSPHDLAMAVAFFGGSRLGPLDPAFATAVGSVYVTPDERVDRYRRDEERDRTQRQHDTKAWLLREALADGDASYRPDQLEERIFREGSGQDQ